MSIDHLEYCIMFVCNRKVTLFGVYSMLINSIGSWALSPTGDNRPISQTVFMLSIAINRAEHVCATVIIKHNYMLMCNHKIVMNTVAYAGFLKGGGAQLKFFWKLDIHAAKRHVASSEAASRC